MSTLMFFHSPRCQVAVGAWDAGVATISGSESDFPKGLEEDYKRYFEIFLN